MTQKLALSHNKRYTFIGKTRSGKSFLSWYLLHIFARRPNLQIIFIDPKHEHKKFGKGETLDLAKLVENYEPHTKVQVFQSWIWTPALDDMVNQVLQLQDNYRKKKNKEFDGAIVVLDEVGGLATATTVPDGMTRLWTQGGGKNVGAWAMLQRPRRVPAVIKSQTEMFCIFRINPEEERKDIQQYIGDERIVTQKIPLHYFWMFTDDMDQAIFCKPINVPRHMQPK